MNIAEAGPILKTNYNRSTCQVGVVHLGFGAFHRSHQAVYIDDYMDKSGDLRWGIAAVNLRASEAAHFKTTEEDIERHDGYYLKSYSADGQVELRQVRSHVRFADWSLAKAQTEALLSLPSVQVVTITVTESGYYTDPNGQLNLNDATIKAEVSGDIVESVYGYLRVALAQRIAATGAPITIACCDNIRQNGKMLQNNLLSYLKACNDHELANWVETNAAFPCSMVDRITPRSPDELGDEFTSLVGKPVTSPVMAEDFSQWVLQDQASTDMPDLAQVGLLEHFQNFENKEVLPALTLSLPFSKTDYLEKIIQRFGNAAIGDTVARICADGMVKFPIFIRPTLESCLKQGIMPTHSIRSIASWYVFALHVDAGNIGFKYVEPNWNELKTMLGTDLFITNPQLWGELPLTYPEFAETLRSEIVLMESKWPV